jgi:hypothetical protein
MAPSREAPQKKGSGLIIGLGVLAVALLGGGIYLGVRKPPRTTTTTSLDLGPTATASASVAHVEEPPPVIASAPALDPGNPKTPVTPQNNNGGGTPKKTTPTPTPVPTPLPAKKPDPPKPEPQECITARERQGKASPKVQANLDAQCAAARARQ